MNLKLGLHCWCGVLCGVSDITTELHRGATFREYPSGFFILSLVFSLLPRLVLQSTHLIHSATLLCKIKLRLECTLSSVKFERIVAAVGSIKNALLIGKVAMTEVCPGFSYIKVASPKYYQKKTASQLLLGSSEDKMKVLYSRPHRMSLYVKATFHDIPPNVLERAFLLLRRLDVVALSLVCRAWRPTALKI